MDISRLKKVLAGFSVAAITLSQVGTVFAAYSDVSSGVWYEAAVNKFTTDGILDASQPQFRGGDNANRAEFVKLLVMLNGGLLSTPPAVASFDDVKSSAWYYAYMEEAAKEQWVRGDGNCYGSHPCYARPGANINRAEAAALIVRAFGLQATGAAPQFVDNPSGQWYTDAIQTAADHCVLQGDDSTGRVRPSDNMNRAEMVVMLYRVDQGLTYGTDCGTGQPTAKMGITKVTATSTTTVEVQFSINLDKTSAETASNYSVTGASPAVSVTTASLVSPDTVQLTLSGQLTGANQYTVTASNVKAADGTVFSDSQTFTGYTALPTSNSTLSVAVSSKNPVGDTIPQGAVGVTMLSMDITASCDDKADISDVTILHEGFGAATDIDGVYITVNGARISRKRTIDSKDQTATVHLSTPLEIAACKTVTVDVAADFTSTATTAAEHNLTVELPSDVMGNAKQVTGNFPLRGNTFKIAAVRSGRVSIEYRTVSPDKIEVGDKGVVLGKFQVSTDSTEDQTIYSMTLEQNGTAHDGDITNLKVRRSDGTILTNTVATTVGNFVTFVFDPPFTVLEGDKMTMDVIGDVNGGANNDVKMHFEETSDVFAVGSLYGYGVNGQLYGSRIAIQDETSTLPTVVNIDAGQFTVEINGPSQQSYTRDQNDAVLANVIFTTGGEQVNIRKLFMLIQGNSASGGTLSSNDTTSYDSISEVIQNVQLRNVATGRSINGVRLTDTSASGESSTVPGTFQIYRFDDFTVNGQETYEVRVDFIDNGSGHHPKGGDTFKIHICGEPTEVDAGANTTGCTLGGFFASTTTTYQMQVEGLSTGDKVHDVRPGGTITGNAQRIADASLTIAVKATGNVDTAVKNSKNVNLLRFEARSGEAKDLLLTKLIFNSASGSLNNGQNYTLWVDTDGDGKVDTVLQKGISAQSNKVTFSQLTGGGFVIPKEKTVVFEVHSDIAASLTNNDLQIAFSTADTFIEAETVDRGSSLSGIKLNGAFILGATSADITVSTVTSELWLLVGQGDLYVTQDTTPIHNRQLLGGVLSDAILRLNFHAENEDIDVTDIQLNSSGSKATSVDHLELYKEGSTTPFGSATIGGCGSDQTRSVNLGAGNTPTQAFCAKMQSRQLIVPKGSDVKVLVKPSIKTDVDGAVSGSGVQFYIVSDSAANNASGSGAIRARGDQSSNTLSRNGGDGVAAGEIFIGIKTATSNNNLNAAIVGTRNFTVLSKIQTIANANPDANGTNVPTGVSDIGQFKISAAPNNNSKNGLNKVILSGVIFNVNATNVAMDTSTFKFYNKANSTVSRSCTAINPSNGTALLTGTTTASGSFVVDCLGLANTALSSVNTTIDQGTDQTFVLQANVTNPKISNSSTSTLQVSIVNFDSLSNTVFGPSSSNSHFEWIDSDGTSLTAGHGTTADFLWVEYPDTTVKSTSYQG